MLSLTPIFDNLQWDRYCTNAFTLQFISDQLLRLVGDAVLFAPCVSLLNVSTSQQNGHIAQHKVSRLPRTQTSLFR